MSEKELIKVCLDHLECQGIDTESSEHQVERSQSSSLVVLSHGQTDQTYRVEVRHNLNTSDIHRINHLRRGNERPLLVLTSYVTPQRAKLFFKQGVQFVDLGGNMNLHFPGLMIRISGEPKPPGVGSGPKHRRWGEATIRAAFVILVQYLESRNGHAPLKLKWVVENARISMGAASNARKDLLHFGHLGKIPEGYVITDIRGFIDDWVSAYGRILYPKLHLATVSAKNLELKGVWGGESAAHRLTGNLRPEIETLYIEEALAKWKFQHAGKIDKSNTQGSHRVSVREVFWQLRDECPETPALLTYADLLATEEGRNIEIAEEIYERFLKSSLP